MSVRLMAYDHRCSVNVETVIYYKHLSILSKTIIDCRQNEWKKEPYIQNASEICKCENKNHSQHID